MTVKKVMTIAGSDSSAGAGLQADLKTFAAMGVYGVSAVTAVTVQNTVEVSGIHCIPPEIVARQIAAVFEDMDIDAVKVGMLSNTGVIEAVCEQLKRFKVANIVVDPVLVATCGDLLMDERVENVVWAIRNRLIPLAHIVTPNIPETEILTGREICGLEDMRAAAIDIQSLGVPNVIIKGGHLDTPEYVVDLLFDGEGFHEFAGKRISTRNTHGTGCTFASAVAAGLAKGRSLREAVSEAKAYVSTALEHSYSVGRGGGPPNHFAGMSI